MSDFDEPKLSHPCEYCQNGNLYVYWKQKALKYEKVLKWYRKMNQHLCDKCNKQDFQYPATRALND